MILCIDCRSECVDRRLIFLINMLVICLPFLRAQLLLDQCIKYLDAILSIPLYMVNSHIHVLEKLPDRPRRIRRRADAGTDGQYLQRTVL